VERHEEEVVGAIPMTTSPITHLALQELPLLQEAAQHPVAPVQLAVVVAPTLQLLPAPRQHHNLQALPSASKPPVSQQPPNPRLSLPAVRVHPQPLKDQ
jgi:hypothetical protein